MVQNYISKISGMAWAIDLKTWFKVISHPLPTGTMRGMSKKGRKESVVLTRIFLGVLIYDPFSHCSPFIQRFSAGELVWNRLGEREKIYMILTRILNRSAMTLTFDPEVGSISLHTFYTYWVKYEQDWVNWTQNPDLWCRTDGQLCNAHRAVP